MSMLLPNGPGQVLGDRLATGVSLAVLGSDTVLFVGPDNASDADSGVDPLRPLATVQQAHTNAADDNIIVLMDGVQLSGDLTVSKTVIFTGGGQNSGRPTVTWSSTNITVSAPDVEFRNIKFLVPSESDATPLISIAAADCVFRNCYFEMNGNNDSDGVISIGSGGNRTRFESCTFVVTSTSVTDRPPAAIYIAHASVTKLDIFDCTFDAGTTGFDTTASGVARFGYAIDCAVGTAPRLRFQNLTLLRGPDIIVGSGSLGYVQIQTNTGGSKVLGL